MWFVYVPEHEEKRVRRFPKRDRETIAAVLLAMKKDPFGGNTKKLYRQRYRRRVGSYRIVFDALLDKGILAVKAIQRRTTTTYRKKR